MQCIILGRVCARKQNSRASKLLSRSNSIRLACVGSKLIASIRCYVCARRLRHFVALFVAHCTRSTHERNDHGLAWTQSTNVLFPRNRRHSIASIPKMNRALRVRMRTREPAAIWSPTSPVTARSTSNSNKVHDVIVTTVCRSPISMNIIARNV